jgi:hypothetical protein
LWQYNQKKSENMLVLKQLKNHTFFLLLLFCFSLLIRALLFGLYTSQQQRFYFYDASDYHYTASQICAGNGCAKQDGSPFFYRLPGYPTFLALGYKLFDKESKPILWAQVIIGALIPVLVFILALMLFNSSLPAKIAACMAAIHLGLVLFSGLIAPDILFTTIFLIFLIIFFQYYNPPLCPTLPHLRYHYDGGPANTNQTDQRIVFLSGIILGIASLIRPNGHFIGILLLILLGLQKESFYKKIKTIFIFFSGWLMVVIGWLTRNFLLTGYLFFHTLPGDHFLTFGATPLEVYAQQCTYEEATLSIHKKVTQKIDLFVLKNKAIPNEVELCDLKTKLFLDIALKHPLYTAWRSTLNMFRTTVGLYSSDLLLIYEGGDNFLKSVPEYLFSKRRTPLICSIIFFEIIFLLLMLIGFFGQLYRSFITRDYCLILKLLPFIALFIALTAACGGVARLRLPIDPLLIIIATYFWSNYDPIFTRHARCNGDPFN